MVARRASGISLLILFALSGVQNVRGALITSFQDAFQPGTPAPGWSYLWNNGGPIGDPANYTPLLANSSGTYTSGGVESLPAPGPGKSVNFGFVGDQPGGHPGPGLLQAGSDNIERCAIAAYTVTSPNKIAILDGWIRNSNPNSGGSSDGLSLKVFVNGDPTPKLSSGTAPGFDSTTLFNVALGDLTAGDTIYVAVGSNSTDLFDSFLLRYDIVSVPEPSVTSLIAMAAGWGIIVVRYPRAREPRLNARRTAIANAV